MLSNEERESDHNFINIQILAPISKLLIFSLSENTLNKIRDLLDATIRYNPLEEIHILSYIY